MSEQLDNAAAAALFMLGLTEDPKLEHLGALYASGDTVQRTPTITSSRNSGVQGKLAVPAGSLMALFHNHPTVPSDIHRLQAEGGGEQFSKDDMLRAKTLKVPSYISTPSGALRMYDPASGDTTNVVAEFPWDEFKGYLMRKLLDRAPDDPRGLYK